MNLDQEALLTVMTPVLVFGAAVVSSWWTRRTSREVNSTTGWKALNEETRAWVQMQLAEQDERIDELEETVDKLNVSLRFEQRLVSSTVHYIHTLILALRVHAPHVPIPEPPDEVRDRIDTHIPEPARSEV